MSNFSRDFSLYWSHCLGTDGTNFYLPEGMNSYYHSEGAQSKIQDECWDTIQAQDEYEGTVAEYSVWNSKVERVGADVFFSDEEVHDTMEFKLPKAGWVNEGANSYYLYLTGERQYVKGTSRSVVVKYYPNITRTKELPRMGNKGQLKALIAAFNRKAPYYSAPNKSIQAVLAYALRNKLDSLQISNELMFIKSAAKQYNLYFRNQLLCQITSDGHELFSKNKSIYKDLTGGT